ncbi:MAG: nucleotide exchange factor GrpE [Patescibacteria group bacterium]
MAEKKVEAMSQEELIGRIEELTGQLEESQKQAEENLAGWQRARADYSNLQKDHERRQGEIVEFANAAFMAEVLPLYSHFKLALKHIPEAQQKEPWVQGIEQIRKIFLEFLNKYKIEEIKTVGEKFDHNIHEAITYEDKDGFDEDVVFEEVQPGYMVEGKVLVPAKVKVAK